MANDFTNDANCKALWNFDDGALTTDSKGTNTLTNSGVTADTVDFKEGNASGDFKASFGRINDEFPWLCKNFFRSEKCAWDYYSWDKVRPVRMDLDVSEGMIPNLGARHWYGIDALAFQVDVELYISSPTSCPQSVNSVLV